MELPELPHIICLQETHLTASKIFQIPGYQPPIRKDRPLTDTGKASGGVAILVKNSINFTRNTVPPDIECLSIKMFIHDTSYNISNYYQSDSNFDSLNALDPLFQLERHVMCGDFNAHSEVWGHPVNSMLKKVRFLSSILKNIITFVLMMVGLLILVRLALLLLLI